MANNNKGQEKLQSAATEKKVNFKLRSNKVERCRKAVPDRRD